MPTKTEFTPIGGEVMAKVTKWGRSKRVLSDAEYLAWKKRGAESKDLGDGFEELLRFVLQIRYAWVLLKSKRVHRDVKILHQHHAFVDDIAIFSRQGRWVRYCHAKAGRTVKWGGNLVRDFRSQEACKPKHLRHSLELWLGSREDQTRIQASAPPLIPKVRFHHLNRDWIKANWASIAYITDYLDPLINRSASPQLREMVIEQILSAMRARRNSASVLGIMNYAYGRTNGAIKSLNKVDPPLVHFVLLMKGIPGIEVAADGKSLIYWNTEFRGRSRSGPDKVDFTWLQSRISTLGLPTNRRQFLDLVQG